MIINNFYTDDVGDDDVDDDDDLDPHDGEDEPKDEADKEDVDDGGDGIHQSIDNNLRITKMMTRMTIVERVFCPEGGNCPTPIRIRPRMGRRGERREEERGGERGCNQ